MYVRSLWNLDYSVSSLDAYVVTSNYMMAASSCIVLCETCVCRFGHVGFVAHLEDPMRLSDSLKNRVREVAALGVKSS